MEDCVYLVDESGALKAITEDMLEDIFSVPVSSESENSDLDEDELGIDGDQFFTSKFKRNNILNSETLEILPDGLCQPSTSASGNSVSVTEVGISVTEVGITLKPYKPVTEVNQIKRKILWKQENFKPENTDFKIDNTAFPQDILSLETPYDFFSYFFNSKLMEIIASQSSLYSIQVDPSKPVEISVSDVRKYLGICIISSVATMKNIRLYWHSLVGIPVVKETMPVNTFERVRRFLHFNNNCETDHTDKLFKIRPVFDYLNEKFRSVPMEESLSVDEQICATKARHHLKMYMPDKPHKYGYKIFVLCGVSGYAYNLEIYTGKGKEDRLESEPDLGTSSNIVVRLTRHIPSDRNHKVYFDNYYTSIQVLDFLRKRGILSLGTVRRNRIPNCKLPDEKDMKNHERGSIVEYVGDFEGTKMANVLWKDNKMVMMLSTLSGAEPVSSVRRFDRKKKQYIQIKCPNVVQIYNKHMGGVDLLDSLIGRYRILMRSRKWYMRIFYHLLDISVINAWLLYRRVSQIRPKVSNQKKMKLVDFRLQLGETLCKIGTKATPKRGRPSTSDEEILAAKKKKYQPTGHRPTVDVRWDQIGHFPHHGDKKQRCKNEHCKSYSIVKCKKCNIFLCFNKQNNCFEKFHCK